MLARSLAVTLALSAAVVSAAAPFLTIASAENAGTTVVTTGVQNLLDPGSPITLVSGSVSTELNLPTDRDMNDDGVVDAADISLIRAYLEGGANDAQ